MPTISEAEKQERRRTNASVIGSHAIEGLELDLETRTLMERYAEGEIDGDQLSAALRQHALSVANANFSVAQVA